MRRLRFLLPLGVVLAVVSGTSLAADQSVQSCCALGTNQNTFTPKTVTIDVGDTVTWRNEAGGIHNVTFDDGSFDQPANASADPWTVSRKFDAAGEFRYYCEEHGNRGGVGMAGTVIVGGGAQPPPPGGDVSAPGVSSLRAAPATFCNKKSDACPRTGVKISFTLSEAATAEATVLRRDTGDVVKVLTFKSKSGKNSFKYSGKGLPRGKYRLELTAVDKANNRSKPAKASFKIAKKR